MDTTDGVPEHQTPTSEKLPPIDERLTKTPEEANIMEQMLRDQLAMIKNLSAYLPVELAIVVVQRPKEYSDALKDGTTAGLLEGIKNSDPVYQFIAESKKEPVQAAITPHPTPEIIPPPPPRPPEPTPPVETSTPTPEPREMPSPITTPAPYPTATPPETPRPTQPPHLEPTPTPRPEFPQTPYPVAPTPTRVPPIDDQIEQQFSGVDVNKMSMTHLEDEKLEPYIQKTAVVPGEIQKAFSGNSTDNVILDPNSPPKT